MERGSFDLSDALEMNRFILYLNLTGNAIGNEGISYILPAIAKSNTVRSLNLTSNDITSGPIRQLIQKEKQRQGLSSKYVDLQMFPSLAPFKHGRSIDEDKKDKNRYRLQSAHLIKDFLEKSSSVKEFSLKQNKIGDEGMAIIAQALDNFQC